MDINLPDFARDVEFAWEDKEIVLEIALSHAHTLAKFTNDDFAAAYLERLYDRSVGPEDFVRELEAHFSDWTEEVPEPPRVEQQSSSYPYISTAFSQRVIEAWPSGMRAARRAAVRHMKKNVTRPFGGLFLGWRVQLATIGACDEDAAFIHRVAERFPHLVR